MHPSRRLLFFPFFFLLLFSVSIGRAEQPFLFQNGHTDYVIVVPTDEPTIKSVNLKASEELKTHLSAVSGACFSIVPENQFDGKTPALYVGDTSFAAQKGLSQQNREPESWVYKTVGKDMVFYGGKSNGALIGVYEFLERELGCHWFTFESSVTPPRSQQRLENWNQSGTPAFLTRSIYTPCWGQGLSSDRLLEYRRCETRNRSSNNDPALIISNRPGTCHTFYQYVSWEKYFDTHPEYFTMNEKGERIHGPSMHSGGQLCLSNPEVAKLIVEQLKRYIQQDREQLPPEQWPTVYDISQNDNFPYICKCPACTKITQNEGGEAALTLTCMNYVAKEIAKSYPEIFIQTFAYVSTETAPKTLRPEDNLLMRWCDLYTRSDCYRPITHPFNASRKEQLDGWKAIGAHIALWDYWNMGILDGPYFKPPRIETNVDAIPGDIRYYREAGVKTFFTEMETNQHVNPQNFVDLQIWLGYQLLDNPDQDENQLINTYITGHYGPAAQPMKQALDLIREAVGSSQKPLIYISNPRRPYQTPEFLRQLIDLIRKAQDLAGAENDFRRRVDKELITPLAVMLNNPQLIPVRQPRWTKADIAVEYKSLRQKRIETYCDPKKKDQFLKTLEEETENYTYQLPTPEKFKNVPEDKIRKFAFNTFNNVQNDPDSSVGKAMRSPDDKADLHNMREKGPAQLLPTWFGVYDSETKKSLQFRTPETPTDQAYHWYKLGRFEVGPRTIVWGFFWIISADLREAWTNADGMADYNTWDVWVNAKFTGPEYVPGSDKPNAIWIDQVILTKGDLE